MLAPLPIFSLENLSTPLTSDDRRTGVLHLLLHFEYTDILKQHNDIGEGHWQKEGNRKNVAQQGFSRRGSEGALKYGDLEKCRPTTTELGRGGESWSDHLDELVLQRGEGRVVVDFSEGGDALLLILLLVVLSSSSSSFGAAEKESHRQQKR